MKLTLLNFAYYNIKRDFKTYLYHFLSCVFSVFIFFLFSVLSMHPALKIVDKGSTIGLVLFTASIVSMIFSFVLILYSVGNFLKNRSRQFAILNIIGASKKQFKKLIFLENMIISLLSLFVGIVSGLIFSKLFLLIAQTLIDNLKLNFYLPFMPIMLTIGLMGGLFLLISLLAPIILRKKKIIDLLKKEEVAEKSHFVLSSLALVIFLGPTIYFHLKRDYFTLIYILDLLSFISISYFLFNLIFSIYHLVMKKSGKIYVKSNLIRVTNFKYKIHTNIKTMAGAMILFFIVLTSFVYIVGAPLNVAEDTEKIMPYAYMYANWENEADGDKKAEIISNSLSKKQGFKELTIRYSKFQSNEKPIRHIVLSQSMYNDVADLLKRDRVSLADDEYFLVGVNGKKDPVLGDKVRKKLDQYGIKKENGLDRRIIALSGYFSSVTVISDKKYDYLSKDLVKEKIYAFMQADFIEDNQKEVRDLKKDIGFEIGKETFMTYYDYYESENLTRRLVSYVGSILCISFLIGIASIIYSRLYSSVEEESKKYSIMIKIGLSQEELNGILASTLRWVFILPFLVSLLETWIFITLINQVTLTSYTNLAGICSLIYIILGLIMYIVIKKKYKKTIYDNIYGS
ncbi:ABC transporter permease [Peptostreptococcus stomatis]|uniref:ABC transporter permease n=1 Tax=Peptostreptococcus stomatis TaxID=341694 RepID=UPI0028E8B764|nr:ABC transporter permease [Peptostreptococcus stomatis]